jgi:hypothetical protein
MKIFMAAHIIHGSTLPILRPQNNKDAWARPTIPTSGQSDRAGNIMLYFDPSLRKQFYGEQARTSLGVPSDGTRGGILRTLIDQECCVAVMTPEPQGKGSIQQCFAVFATNTASTSYKYWTGGGRNLSVGLVEAVKYRKLAGSVAEFDGKRIQMMARKPASASRLLEDRASLAVYREYMEEYLKSVSDAIHDKKVDNIVVLGGDNTQTRKGIKPMVYAGLKSGTDLMTGDGSKNNKLLLERVRKIGFVHDVRFTRLYTILTHLIDQKAHKDLIEMRRLQAASEKKPKSEEKEAHEEFVKELFVDFKKFQKACEKYVDDIVVLIRKERSSLIQLSPQKRSNPFLCIFDQALVSPCAKIVKVYNLRQNVTGDLFNVVCSNATHGTSFMETLTAIILHQTQGGMPISPSQLQQIVGRITRRCSTQLHYIPRRGMPEIRIYSLVSTSLSDIVRTSEQKVRKTRVSGSSTNGNSTNGSKNGNNENGLQIKELGFFDSQHNEDVIAIPASMVQSDRQG